jgi:hypothetical protein
VSSRRGRLIALALIFAAAIVAGAYGDWMWWEPYSGLLITLAAAAILVVAVVFAIPPRGRGVAVVAAAVGIGLLAGQNLGPSRPALNHGEGTLTVTLAEPVQASASIAATCAADDGLTELQVAGDPNLRIAIVPDNPAAPVEVDQREFVGVYLTVGDRWGRSDRPDRVGFEMSVGRAEADAVESRVMAGPSSTVDVDWTATGGTVTFAGLVPDTRFDRPAGEFIDVSGTVEWTCPT